MRKALRNLGVLTFRKTHFFLFGHDVTTTMKEFMSNLSLSFVAYFLSNGILFIAILLAGRLLGPFEFGQYALVMAISQILIIFMLPGIETATMRQVALEYTDEKKMRATISSGLVFTTVTSLVVGMLAWFFASTIADYFSFSSSLFRIAIIVSLAMVARSFFDSVIRGKGEFKLQLRVKVLDSLIVFGIFILGYTFFVEPDYRLLIAGLVLGSTGSAFLFYRWSLDKFIEWGKVDFTVVSKLWHYARFAVFGGLGGVMLLSVDKILIGNVLGSETLGLYQAYSFASLQIAGQLAFVFLNVFFPAVVRQRDLTVVLRKIDKLIIFGLVPAFLFIVSFVYLILRLFSSEYELNSYLVIAMSVYSVFWFLTTIYLFLIASTGPDGLFYSSITGFLAGALYLAIVYYLIPSLGLFAPSVSFMFAFVFMFFAALLWRLKFSHTIR